MPLNIIKLAVGANDLPHLHQWQQANLHIYQDKPANLMRTRQTPKRAEEILESGGSLYRVIKGFILCRQKIIGIEKVAHDHENKTCHVFVSPQLIRTATQPYRPFQGWRYLKAEDAPADIGPYDGETLAEENVALREELATLGLL